MRYILAKCFAAGSGGNLEIGLMTIKRMSAVFDTADQQIASENRANAGESLRAFLSGLKTPLEVNFHFDATQLSPANPRKAISPEKFEELADRFHDSS